MKRKVVKLWTTKSNHEAVITLITPNTDILLPWFCGYVGLTSDHPLYEANSRVTVSFLKLSDINGQGIGKRGPIPFLFSPIKNGEEICPDTYFDVHGSITYSGVAIDNKWNQSLWWFGFDCGHAEDMDNPKNLNYVISECESLSKQLAEV